MIRNPYVKAICIGIVAGMRCMSAPALVSNYLTRKNSDNLAASSFKLMSSERTANVLKIAALGELVADKLPFIPDRISPGALTARILSGAVCGATICAADAKRVELGAMAGGLSAVGSAYAFYYLRQKLADMENLPDAALGLGEDLLAIGVGVSVLSNKTST